jgi:hypothetical protein
MSSGEKGAVMGEVGVHIEAKRGRGRLRDGGASQEYMFFFPVKGSRGQRVQSVYTLGEFWVLKYTRVGVRKDRLQQRVRS